METYSLPDPLRQTVEDELQSGERIIWSAQPNPTGSFPKMALIPFFFAIPWTLFALFWMAGASGVLENGVQGIARINTGRLVFALFGIPFVLVGLGMLSAPIWIRRWIRRSAARTAYVITERRAIIFDGGYYGDGGVAAMAGTMPRLMGKGLHVRSYEPSQLGQVQRVQREDGSGDVIFDEVQFHTNARGQHVSMRAGFFSIADVREVEQMLKALAEAADN